MGISGAVSVRSGAVSLTNAGIFASFGSAEETNTRYRYLLNHGQTGLSVAFDRSTLMGYDTDDEWGVGELGEYKETVFV